jgi:ACDE family multidrug resistance protein
VPKDKDKPLEFKEFLAKTKDIFKNEGKWLLTVFLVGMYVMLILFGVLFYLSDILEKVHDLHGVKKGFILAIPLFGLCVASFITGRKIKGNVATMKTIITICLLLIAASIIFVGYTSANLVFLLIVTSLLGIGIGAVLPTLDALITENIEKDERGTISSFYSSSRFIGVAAGPPIMSVIMKDYLSISYISAGVIAILIGVLVLIFIKTAELQKGS